ncbi:MAG: hypothetical protein Q9195_008256 [Heterodermia aff. obscurata]
MAELSFADSIYLYSEMHRLGIPLNISPEENTSDDEDTMSEEATSPPLSTTNEPASPATNFRLLPAELRLRILTSLPSLIDLRHAITASRALHHAYMANQKVVLTAVMKNAVLATYGNMGKSELWTRMWVGGVVGFVIEGKWSFEMAMGGVGARGLGWY